MGEPTTRYIRDITRDLREGILILKPEFQRDFVWSQAKQKALLKSVHFSIPLPMFYFGRTNDAKLEVIDGQQRLTTIAGFIDPKLIADPTVRRRLTRPPKHFSKSKDPVSLKDLKQKALNTKIYVVEVPGQDANQKYEIFKLLNQGATALKPQEIRNSILAKDAPELRSELKRFSSRLESMLGAKLPRKLGEELALRFYAIRLHGLDASIRYRIDDIAWIAASFDVENRQLKNDAKRFLDFCEKLYNGQGESLFQMPRDLDHKNLNAMVFSGKLNQALFQVMSYYVPRYAQAMLNSADMGKVRKLYARLLIDQDFRDAVTMGSTNSERNIKKAKEVAEVLFFQPAFGNWAAPPARMISAGEKRLLLRNIPYCYLTYCQIDPGSAEFDHIDPYSRVATTNVAGILPVTRTANRKKMAMSLDAFRATPFFLEQRAKNKENILGFISSLSAFIKEHPSESYSRILRLARKDLREAFPKARTPVKAATKKSARLGHGNSPRK